MHYSLIARRRKASSFFFCKYFVNHKTGNRGGKRCLWNLCPSGCRDARFRANIQRGCGFSLTFVVHLTLFVGFRLRRDFEEIAFLRGDEMAAYRRDCDVLSSRIGAATRRNDAETTNEGVSATIDSKLRRILTVTWMNAREKHLFEQITRNLRAKLTRKRAPE